MKVFSLKVSVADKPEKTINIKHAQLEKPLSSVLAKSGIVLNTRCGQKGLCRGCEIKDSSGNVLKSCQLKSADVLDEILSIDERSLISNGMSITIDFQPRTAFVIGENAAFTSRKPLGLCIDIGTTTVAMLLVRGDDGSIEDKESAYNSQVQIGADVLTRIDYCGAGESAVEKLRALIMDDTLYSLWEKISDRNQIRLEEIAEIVVCGNTTMLHLLVGEDPSPMGKVPFAPNFLELRKYNHNDFAWPISSADTPAWVLLPGYAAYVGSDISAGWLCSGMVDHQGCTLLIDIGTNGEMILKSGDQLIGCATAAGPAFEGEQLSWGTRAVDGSISRMQGSFEDQLQFVFVGPKRKRPVGFCGAAYIDFLALGKESGLLSERGRFDMNRAKELGIELMKGEEGIYWPFNSEDPTGPSISEPDIAILLQAKAAIAAGAEILLNNVGIRAESLETVYIAGGFGFNLGIDSAISCGLLGQFSYSQIEVVGNTALGGAYIALLDPAKRALLSRSCELSKIIELNLDPDFEDTYIDHLNLE